MKNSKNLEELVRNFLKSSKEEIQTTPEFDKRVFNSAARAYQENLKNFAYRRPNMQKNGLAAAASELEKIRRNKRVSFDAALWRSLMKNKMIKIGTVAVLAIAALVVFQFVGNPVGPNLTFAQVIEPILKAHTAAYDIVFGPDDGNKPVIHDLVMGSRIRRRVADYRAVSIIDLENRRTLVLDEAYMEARYMVKEMPSSQNFPKGMASGRNYLEELKNTILRLKDMPDYTVEELGRKQLDGREVVGFFASHPMIEMTIWADVDTGLPVHIEHNVGTMHVTYKNMEFDLPMEKEMFSMEVPAGYTVQEPVTMDLQATEDNFIKGLRLIAEKLNYGRFPDDVSYDNFSEWMLDGFEPSQFNAMSKEEVLAIGQELVEYIYFTVFFPGEGEWTYRGKGVRLGETETPIFWYRPKGSETYRVIYGDLHVEDVYPENLPD